MNLPLIPSGSSAFLHDWDIVNKRASIGVISRRLLLFLIELISIKIVWMLSASFSKRYPVLYEKRLPQCDSLRAMLEKSDYFFLEVVAAPLGVPPAAGIMASTIPYSRASLASIQ